MPKESRSRMQKWPSSTLCPPNSTVTGTTHFYPVAIRSAHVICAQALTGENPSNHVFVDGDVESQGNLLSNARTAPGGIALLHLDHGFNEFFGGAFGAGPTPALGGEEPAILAVPQSLVEAQEGRRFQNDG